MGPRRSPLKFFQIQEIKCSAYYYMEAQYFASMMLPICSWHCELCEGTTKG